MKIALISEHASPLATPVGADGGGRNVRVSRGVGAAEAARVYREAAPPSARPIAGRGARA